MSWRRIVGLLLLASLDVACGPIPMTLQDSERETLYSQAMALHLKGRLREAGRLYARLLEADPPRPPTEEEQALVLRYAPRLFVTPQEPFPLLDVIAILHPERPLIAYHLFWEDDIDYPEDQEPCDHELVWVAYDPERGSVTGVYTYYHGQILDGTEAVAEAARHEGRPWIGVQWGKHGSLPYGWEAIGGGTVLQNMRRTYRRLSTEGHRLRNHPLAAGWPATFTGTWEEFVDFSRLVDSREWLRRERTIFVSRWGNAVLDQYALRYNFHPKLDWPDG
ncbi:MAG: hypothetical protein D6759_00445 [Chloroflexi bacterium]|nr:MAG: hypothetical protein D6759_00445 [Chloroflexota bacterium]